MATQPQSPTLREIQNASTTRSGNKSFLVIIIIILLIILSLVAYQVITGGGDELIEDTAKENQETDSQDEDEQGKDDDSVTTTPTQEQKQEESGGDGTEGDQAFVFDSTLPGSWKKVEGLSLDYTIYRPGNWWYKLFGSMLGLDPNEIPSASEYAGMITMTKLGSISQAQAISDAKSGLSDVNQFNAVAGENDWVIIQGIVPETISTEKKKTKIGITTQKGVTYKLEYRVPPGQFAANENVFDTLLGVIKFN